MGQWPWEAIAACVTLALTHFVNPLIGLFRRSEQISTRIHEKGWERASELEEEIVLLREALHRQLIDRNSYSTALEIGVMALGESLEKRVEAVRRMREIIQLALSRGGGRP